MKLFPSSIFRVMKSMLLAKHTIWFGVTYIPCVVLVDHAGENVMRKKETSAITSTTTTTVLQVHTMRNNKQKTNAHRTDT